MPPVSTRKQTHERDLRSLLLWVVRLGVGAGSARSGAVNDAQARRTLDDLVSTPSGVTMKATALNPKLDALCQTMTKYARPMLSPIQRP